MEAETQVVRVVADITGLPEVMALAHAARDVADDIDRAGATGSVTVGHYAALAKALEPILPGAVKARGSQSPTC